MQVFYACCWLFNMNNEYKLPLNPHTHTHTHTHIYIYIHEGWNFNSDNYLFTTDTK